MKRKLLYFAQWNYSKSNGISNKIIGQVDGLNEFYNTDLCLIENEVLTFNNTPRLKANNGILGKVRKYFSLLKIIRKNNYDYLYIRNVRGISSALLILVLFFTKKQTQINLEIPTYPFESENQQSNVLIRVVEAVVQKLYKYVVGSITYMGTETDSIWGIDAIKIENGVDVVNMPLKKDPEKGNYINIIGVGSLDYWHGYDRIIEGMVNVNNIKFHIVGDGKERDLLMTLARNLKVDDKVIFHGKLFGESLNNLFDKCNLAVDSLARHRSGNSNNSSIKSKEYTARGIPFILAHDDDSFKTEGFVYRLPSNDDPIDLLEVVSWLKNQDLSSDEIRSFALNNLQWTTQFVKLKEVFPIN